VQTESGCPLNRGSSVLNMKITLIYVGIGVAGFNNNRSAGDREGSWVAHGIASIGASVKKAGYDVSLIDMRQLSGFEHFKALISNDPSDVYGLSVSVVDYYPALMACYEIKKHLPESKIIIGGIHPTVFPDKYPSEIIDTVITGEGEITFVKLLESIKNGNRLPVRIQGEKPELDRLPYIDRELFDYDRELDCIFAPDQKTPSVTMLAGRGCAFRCTYCQPSESSVFGKPYRLRSPENVIDELRILKDKYDFKSITFWDDTFTFSRKWINHFCNLYEYEGIGATIAACSRADIICRNEEMIKRLSEAGLDWLVIGFESGSQRLLDMIKKDTKVEHNIRAADICREYGIKIFATYMYGLPTETEEDSLATATMIDRINPDHDSPFWFVPIEGTEIYDYCVKNNLILDEVKDRTVARTGIYNPSLKGVNYEYIKSIQEGRLCTL
jgi:anaerobic magnesium-protoporphyrin IX monomethyl ester cyclase